MIHSGRRRVLKGAVAGFAIITSGCTDYFRSEFHDLEIENRQDQTREIRLLFDSESRTYTVKSGSTVRRKDDLPDGGVSDKPIQIDVQSGNVDERVEYSSGESLYILFEAEGVDIISVYDD